MDIQTNEINQYIHPLHQLIKGIYGDNFYGLQSWGQAQCYDAATSEEILDISEAVTVHNTLTVEATQTSILADGLDEAIITCDTLPTVIDYAIFRGDESLLSGTINDGSIELSLNEVGIYTVMVKDPSSYATGYIQIEGTE